MQETMVNEKEIGYYNTINGEYSKYVEIEAKAIALAKQNSQTEAFVLLKSEGTPHADKVNAAVVALITEKTTVGDQLSANLSLQGTEANASILIVILLSLIISLFIAVTISRSISKP
jgi:hypothetical protein